MNIELSLSDIHSDFNERHFDETIDENGFNNTRLRFQFASVIPSLHELSDDEFDVLLIMLINKEPEYKYYNELNDLRKHLMKRMLGHSYNYDIIFNFVRSDYYRDLMEKFNIPQLTGETVKKSRRYNQLVQDIVWLVMDYMDYHESRYNLRVSGQVELDENMAESQATLNQIVSEDPMNLIR